MPKLFDSPALFDDEPTEQAPRALRNDGLDAARVVGMDTATLRGGRGGGCASPALGCNRTEFAVGGGGGYLRKGYDSGRWWLK